MRSIILLIITVLSALSCANDEDAQKNKDSTEFVGNWKLIEARILNVEGQQTIDYSDRNIIYNFHSDNTLVVSGGQNLGYPDGMYDYIFGEDYLAGNNQGPLELLVKINDSKWTYDYTNEKMTLGQSYVDGADLIFEKN